MFWPEKSLQLKKPKKNHFIIIIAMAVWYIHCNDGHDDYQESKKK